MSKAPCFYVPKQMFDNKYSKFSAESKLLFGMIFTNAVHTTAIKETSELIDSISENELSNMRSSYSQLQESTSEKEGA